MMNKNALGLCIDMNNSRMVDVMNGQTGEMSLPLTLNPKFDSGLALEVPPIKFQIAFRNEFDD